MSPMQLMPLSQDWVHFTYEVVNEVMKEDVTDLVTFL